LPADQLERALRLWADPSPRGELVAAFLELGFTAVGVDLEGLVSGKLNRELTAPTPPEFRASPLP
jgi:uncharacterized protein